MKFLIGIQRVPYTRYNICPRIRRASRKSSVVGIIVGIVVALVTLVLSSYINYLISIRGEKYTNRGHSVIAHSKNVASIDNSSNTNQSLINNLLYPAWPIMHSDLNEKDENHIILFIILLFIFLLTIILIVIIFVCMYSSRFFRHSIDRKTNNDKLGIPVPVGIYSSVMTQTSVDL